MDTEIKEVLQNYPLTLLLDADPDIKKIEKYLNKGKCYAAFSGNEIVAEYVLKNQKNGTAEIMNLDVAEKYRRQGLGKRMMQDAINRAKTDGFETLTIATGKDSFQQKFYESLGFEIFETVENYFPEHYDAPIIDNGVELKDLVRLRLNLN